MTRTTASPSTAALARWVRGAALCLRMTRPGFLVMTAVGCLVGLASAHGSGVALSLPAALATLVLALLAHAAANLLNDHADALNGADAANVQGLYPFTGGSRLVQNGVVQVQDMRRLALALLVLVVPGGLWLAWHSGPGLLWIGAVGLALGWAYSAPPLALMARGLGELAVACSWALIAVGADYVQRGQWAGVSAAAAVSFGLMSANVLVGNAFPDAASDALVGKRTLAVRLGPRRAAWLYLAVAVLAHGWLLAMVWAGVLPPTALWAWLATPLALVAGTLLLRHGAQPARLRPALVLGIAAVLVHGVALSLGIWNF